MKYSRITADEDYKCQPVFWQTPCCTFALPSVSYKNLAFLLCQPKDCYPSRAEGKLFGRLASVLLALCACQCACLEALAIRDFAFFPLDCAINVQFISVDKKLLHL